MSKRDTKPSPPHRDAIHPSDIDRNAVTCPGGSPNYYDKITHETMVPCPRCAECFICDGTGVCSAARASLWCESTRASKRSL